MCNKRSSDYRSDRYSGAVDLVTMTTSTILVIIIKVDSFMEIRVETTTTHT